MMYSENKSFDLVDSHCHLTYLMKDDPSSLEQIILSAKNEGITHLLSVCVSRQDIPKLFNIAAHYDQVYISVGEHPDEKPQVELSVSELVSWGQAPSCIAIGETGLDYYHLEDSKYVEIQQERFRRHIRAAKILKKPLIIHTRQAAEDTLKILREEQADEIGGVLHCFTESLEMAQQAMDLNFYISFSGIITFKNAQELQAVAAAIPIERILIETDAPYLAPVPFRGQQNQPAWVKYVAEKLAELKSMNYADVAEITTNNFFKCFLKKDD